MTWGEFKKQVESQGVSDDMEIFYIDVHLPYSIDVSPQDKSDPHDLGIAVESH